MNNKIVSAATISLLITLTLINTTFATDNDAHCYIESDSDEKNFTRCEAEAIKGDASAQKEIADRYHLGKGVTQNFEEAAKWYTKSAQQGNATAQKEIADRYHLGEGVTQNFEEAAKWYTKSALQGDADSQNSLGLLYEEGNGVKKSNTQAKMWYRKAADQGHEGAIDRLSLINKDNKRTEAIQAPHRQ